MALTAKAHPCLPTIIAAGLTESTAPGIFRTDIPYNVLMAYVPSASAAHIQRLYSLRQK